LILETKDVLSETVYQALEEASEPLQPEPVELEKPLPRDLVSIPMSRRNRTFLRGVLKAEKKFPLATYQDLLQVEIIESPYPLSGELAGRDLFYLPPEPESEAELQWDESLTRAQEAVFEMVVNAQGSVLRVENVVTSGDAESDLRWKEYLLRWQFMPLVEAEAGDETVGRVRVTQHRQ